RPAGPEDARRDSLLRRRRHPERPRPRRADGGAQRRRDDLDSRPWTTPRKRGNLLSTARCSAVASPPASSLRLNCSGRSMATQERHRGRLIDHSGLVVRDLAASKNFYCAIGAVLEIPLGGGDDRNFWADDLFVSSPDSKETQGELTGRDRKSTRLNSSHVKISYAVFCLKKKI